MHFFKENVSTFYKGPEGTRAERVEYVNNNNKTHGLVEINKNNKKKTFKVKNKKQLQKALTQAKEILNQKGGKKRKKKRKTVRFLKPKP